MDLISVIVPVYNVEKYLDECINSIVKQTYRHLEIILVDDGSTDSSGIICDKWQKKDDRIKVIHIDNNGVSNARNVGLSYARGKYISMIDSDDYISKDMYSKMIAKFEKDNSDIVVCNCYLKYDNCLVENVNKCINNSILNKKQFLTYMCNKVGYCGLLSNKIYKKEILSKVKFYKEIFIMEDFLFNCEVSRYINKVSYIKECLYYYRQREGSALHSYSISKTESLLLALPKIINVLDNNKINSSKKYKIRFLTECRLIKILDTNFYKINKLDKLSKQYLKINTFFYKDSFKQKIRNFLILFFPKTYINLKEKGEKDEN